MLEAHPTEQKTFLRLVVWTLTVIGLMTGLNALVIMNSLGTELFQPLKRTLASEKVVTQVIPEKIDSPVIEVNCRLKRKAMKLNTKASSARIIFKNCADVNQITNHSNQNQGHIFPIKKGFLTSDYLFLSPGKNRIEAKLGKSTQVIEINRKISRSNQASKAL